MHRQQHTLEAILGMNMAYHVRYTSTYIRQLRQQLAGGRKWVVHLQTVLHRRLAQVHQQRHGNNAEGFNIIRVAELGYAAAGWRWYCSSKEIRGVTS